MNEEGNFVIISYDGVINSELCRGLIQAVNNRLNLRESNALIRKIMTQIITECLLNLNHHAEYDSGGPGHGRYVRVSVEETRKQYRIMTKNMVSLEKVHSLSSTLDWINSMDPFELDTHYEAQLKVGQYTSKETAGLGLIHIARKSGSKFEFQFHSATDSLWLFDLSIAIKKDGKKS